MRLCEYLEGTDFTFLQSADDRNKLQLPQLIMYLVAILDVASCKVLAFRLSNTMTTDFCLAAREEAVAKAPSELPEGSYRIAQVGYVALRPHRGTRQAKLLPSAFPKLSIDTTQCDLQFDTARDQPDRVHQMCV